MTPDGEVEELGGRGGGQGGGGEGRRDEASPAAVPAEGGGRNRVPIQSHAAHAALDLLRSQLRALLLLLDQPEGEGERETERWREKVKRGESKKREIERGRDGERK